MSFNAVITMPTWTMGGISAFSANLVRGLVAHGIPAHVLVTRPDAPDSKPLPFPSDIVVKRFPLACNAPRRARWKAMIQYLEGLAPCIYIPNYDYHYSCISPRLS